MSNPFLAEIRIVSFAFAPRGWALCNGQLLAINANQALFSLCGTTYGGNGVSNFALPNLQSRLPMHRGNGFAQGDFGGTEARSLATVSTQVPSAGAGVVSKVAFTPTVDMPNVMPFTVLNFVIAQAGIFPSQN